MAVLSASRRYPLPAIGAWLKERPVPLATGEVHELFKYYRWRLETDGFNFRLLETDMAVLAVRLENHVVRAANLVGALRARLAGAGATAPVKRIEMLEGRLAAGRQVAADTATLNEFRTLFVKPVWGWPEPRDHDGISYLLDPIDAAD